MAEKYDEEQIIGASGGELPDELLNPLTRMDLGEIDFDVKANLANFGLAYEDPDLLGDDALAIGYKRNIQDQGHP